MDKKNHFIFDNERPLELLWEIAKTYGAEKEIKDWMGKYVEIFRSRTSINKEIIYKSNGDYLNLQKFEKERAIVELGRAAADKAHTWSELSDIDEFYGLSPSYARDYIIEHEYSMLVILPNDKNREEA